MPQGRAGLPVLSHALGRRAAVPAARRGHPGRPAARARHRDAGLRRHVQHARRAAPRAAGLRPRHRRHLLDGEPHGQRLRRGHPGAREAAPERCWWRAAPLPTVFPQRYAEHVDAVFRGEADLSFPRFCRDVLRRRLGPARLGELPLRRYPGLFIQNDDLPVDNAPVHHDAAELGSVPGGPTAATSTTPPTSVSGGAAPVAPPPRSWPRSAVPTAATSAPSPCSATTCAAAAWTRCSPRSTSCRPWATTACGSPTTRSRWTCPTCAEFCRRMAGPGHDLELPVARQRHPQRHGRGHARGRLHARVPGPRVGRRRHAAPHEQAGHGGRRGRGRGLYRAAGIEVAALLHRRLPGRDAAGHRAHLRAGADACRWTRSRSTCPCRCPARASSSASASPTTATTGRTRTRSPSCTRRASTPPGCGGAWTRRCTPSRRGGGVARGPAREPAPARVIAAV